MERSQPTSTLHKIITKTAYNQALFFFVQGALETDPNLTPRKAIVLFSKVFEIKNIDLNSTTTQYHRLKCLYIRNNKVFNYDKRNP